MSSFRILAEELERNSSTTPLFSPGIASSVSNAAARRCLSVGSFHSAQRVSNARNLFSVSFPSVSVSLYFGAKCGAGAGVHLRFTQQNEGLGFAA
jgi:hypothetical protein